MLAGKADRSGTRISTGKYLKRNICLVKGIFIVCKCGTLTLIVVACDALLDVITNVLVSESMRVMRTNDINDMRDGW